MRRNGRRQVDSHHVDTSARFDTVEKRFDKVDAQHVQTSARFDRVDKSIAEIDRDLTKHMNVHAEIEKDIEALKRRPARTAARAPRRPRTR